MLKIKNIISFYDTCCKNSQLIETVSGNNSSEKRQKLWETYWWSFFLPGYAKLRKYVADTYLQKF